MQKPSLRPLRLVHIDSIPSQEESNLKAEDENVDKVSSKVGEQARAVENTKHSISGALPPVPSFAIEPDIPLGEAGAQHLLKRTPANYLLNQVYGLWIYFSLFLLTLIITRKVSVEEYGIFAVASAAFNTIAYIVAFGLEDATTTFVPRIIAEHGKAAAALLIRRLLALRMATLIISVIIMLFGLQVLATIIAAIPIGGSAGVAAALRDPSLLGHIAPIAFFVLGNGIASLFTAVYASIMRIRLVFIAGSVAQLLVLVISFFLLRIGWSIDSILWLEAICSLLNAAALALWQAPLLLTRGAEYRQPLGPVVRLGISAWLTNLVSGALLKQVSIILLGYFAVSLAQIAFFNLSFQLAHAASLLLVSGFGGVGGAALAAAFVGKNYKRLGRSWQTLIKIETLLAAPILVFCLFNAQNIAITLYGTNFSPVGPLLAIFLFFNVIVRILGTTIHQSTLYVMGKARLVVLGQWIGLVVVIGIGIVLIPHWGPAGALIADGISQVITGGLLLAFLWRDLPEKYPLGFTLRLLVAFTIAALPELVWHPSGHVMLGVSGVIFLVLSIAMLLLIRPLSFDDLEMIHSLNPLAAKYLKRFARWKR
jgi:O-antigen/teichoic acid export membrane protein